MKSTKIFSILRISDKIKVALQNFTASDIVYQKVSQFCVFWMALAALGKTAELALQAIQEN